ncbi:MAG: hypothetical protein U0X20_05210 [Caldilineaceae bacterium]
MYGCNKLYCEMLGSYFSRYYKQLAFEQPPTIDFRSVRFPGLIGAVTVPSGGTSDYAPEMLHAAAQGQPYCCFVREEARIPFMVMPDAVRALLQLAHAPAAVKPYNVTSFSLSAAEIMTRAGGLLQISFEPDLKREAIVDSWPADIDDERRPWTGAGGPVRSRPRFWEYHPQIRRRYAGVTGSRHATDFKSRSCH